MKKITPVSPTNDRGDIAPMSILKIAKPILGLAFAASISTAAFADDIRLKIAGTWPTKHFGHEIMENMVKEIEGAGVGIKVSYFPASQLGSGEELVEDAIRGNVDMVQALCASLGYANGTIVRELFNNSCPEPHAVAQDGSEWTSDFQSSQGSGMEYLCFQ